MEMEDKGEVNITVEMEDKGEVTSQWRCGSSNGRDDQDDGSDGDVEILARFPESKLQALRDHLCSLRTRRRTGWENRTGVSQPSCVCV